MNYEVLLRDLINIGQGMLESGAEAHSVSNTITRMIKAYDVKNCYVYVAINNIQVTIETKKNKLITQIRDCKRKGQNLSRIDLLRDLARKIYRNKLSVKEIEKKYDAIMNLKKGNFFTNYIVPALGCTSFCVLLSGTPLDAGITFVIAFLALTVGVGLVKDEDNIIISNGIVTCFIMILIQIAKACFLDDLNETCVTIGSIMVLVSSLGLVNGFKDLTHNFVISGILDTVNSFLGVCGIAAGMIIPLYFVNMASTAKEITTHVASNPYIVFFSCALGATFYTVWFNVKKSEFIYTIIGICLTWGTYMFAGRFMTGEFYPNLIASMVISLYSIIMAYIRKCPPIIFLTPGTCTLLPGTALFNMAYHIGVGKFEIARTHLLTMLTICVAIVAGFLMATALRKTIIILSKTFKNSSYIKVLRNKD